MFACVKIGLLISLFLLRKCLNKIEVIYIYIYAAREYLAIEICATRMIYLTFRTKYRWTTCKVLF